MKVAIILLLIVILLIFPTVSIYSQGTKIDDSFFSSALDTIRMVDVYLPDGYNQDDIGIRYPVVYFLHGWGTNHNDYSQMSSAWASLISDSIIHPVILVKPDSYVEPWQGCWYTNSEMYGLFEDYIAHDLVTYIDSSYHTIADVNSRIIIGHSMGGYGAVRMGFKYPDIFNFIISHSGPLGWKQSLGWNFEQMVLENGGSGPFNPNAGVSTEVMFSLAGAFSPNYNNPPYYVDIPIDNNGKIIDSTYAKWLTHSPANLAKQYYSNANIALYFDCGTWEVGSSSEFRLYPGNAAFAETLDSLKFPYKFYSYDGGHWENLQARISKSLTFIDSVMWENTSLETYENKQRDFRLNQNYPNPFNPFTTISYTVPRSGFVSLIVYDVLGREVQILVNDNQRAGDHTILFDASQLSSGIYFYTLQTGRDFMQTRKMLLMR